jgi:uncharacterized protein (UPF0276 family)
MQLAVNYSPQAVELFDSDRITVDLFKCPHWPDLIEEVRQQIPIYVHFPLHVGNGRMDSVDWDQIESCLKTTGTRYVNLHLAPHTHMFPGMPQDTSDPMWREQIVERVLAETAVVVSRFGAENVIMENVPWDPDPDYLIPRPAIEPDVVRRVVHESGCGLLLDTAHARIAALYLGVDQITYVSLLPVDKLREVHITGTVYDEDFGFWRDHFAMTEEDWMLAGHVMARIGQGEWPQPGIVALEYGGVGEMFAWRSESEVIAREMPRLHEMVQTAQSAAEKALLTSEI